MHNVNAADTLIRAAKHPFERPEPRWRDDAPLSRLLVASRGTDGPCVVLDAIGRDVDYMTECESLDAWLVDAGLKPGIWMVEVRLRGTRHWTDCGYEYDTELHYGEVREATREEVAAHLASEWPWDPTLWMENWSEIQAWNPNMSRCIGRGRDTEGCGYTGGKSGDTCPTCGGMVLDGDAIRAAERLADETALQDPTLQGLLRAVHEWMHNDNPGAPEIIEAGGEWLERGCPGLKQP